VFTEKAPYYAEARTVLILRKLYAEPFKEEAFLVPETRERNYPERDYHTAYVGKIEKILIRD
ncbi:MAG: flavin reductase family protein, partial [Clostridia bacterium]|nr:flavin reductase family protein [Clostridia bacterium]